MKELNATQQAIIMSFFDPFVDVIVERILSVTTKKNLSFIPVKKLRIYFMLLYLHWQG